MRKFVMIGLLILGNTILYAQKAPIEVAKGYQIEVKTSAICEMCQYAIEKALAYEKGVKSSSLNLENKVVTIVYDQKKTDPATLRQRIALTGYHADDLQRDAKAYDDLPMCCKDGAHADEN